MSNEAAAEPWHFAAGPASRRHALRVVAIHPRLIVNAAAAAIDSALEGYGITRVMSYQIASDVSAGRLVLLLSALEPPPIPVHFVMQADRSVTVKLRAFIDFAAPLLRNDLTQIAELIKAGDPGRHRLGSGPDTDRNPNELPAYRLI